MSIKTYSPKLKEIENKWHVIDAKDVVLGRLAVIVANTIRGKNKPTFAPHMDCGDNVVIINADKVKTTGNKLNYKKFFWHTGFPGGIKEITWKNILEGKHPERLIQRAVERMITKGPLRRAQMKRLYIYKGENHPHEAQKPEVMDISSLNSKNKR